MKNSKAISFPVLINSRADGEKAPRSKSHPARENWDISLTPFPRSHANTGAQIRMKARRGELSPSDAPDHQFRRPKSADGQGGSRDPLSAPPLACSVDDTDGSPNERNDRSHRPSHRRGRRVEASTEASTGTATALTATRVTGNANTPSSQLSHPKVASTTGNLPEQ
jgi:hypothetical protein